jgi:hypothetical protein
LCGPLEALTAELAAGHQRDGRIATADLRALQEIADAAAETTSAGRLTEASALPSHAWNRWRYHYLQAAFPCDQLRQENARRDRRSPEYEILDTGVFDAVTPPWSPGTEGRHQRPRGQRRRHGEPRAGRH